MKIRSLLYCLWIYFLFDRNLFDKWTYFLPYSNNTIRTYNNYLLIYILAVINSSFTIIIPLISSFVNSYVFNDIAFSIFQIFNLPSDPPVITYLRYGILHKIAP